MDIRKIPEGSRGILLMLAAIFLVRLYAAKTLWVNPDEGNWLYDASLLLKGYTPFVDYDSRSVLYIYSLVPFIKLFGNTLFAGRLLSVIAETVSAYFVFRIGEKLYSRNAGILCAAIFGLAPFGIFFGSVLNSEAYQRLFVMIMLYFLAMWLHGKKDKLLFLAGIFLGAAVLVRESAAIFLVLMPLFFYFAAKTRGLDAAKKTSVVAAGAFIAALPFLVFAISAPHLYGLLPPKELVESPFSAEGISEFVINHSGMALLFLKEAAYLIVPAFLFGAYLLKGYVRKAAFSLLAFFLGALFFGELYSYLRMSNPFNLSPWQFALSLLLDFFFLGAVLAVKSKNITLIKGTAPLSNRFVIFMFAPAVFYLLYWTWHLEYFTELLPAMSIAAALLILSVSGMKNKIGKIFLALLVISALFTQALHVYPPYMQARGVDRLNPPQTVGEVAAYISSHTKESDEIFSNTAFAFEAGRRIIFDISHAMLYHYPATVNDEKAMRSLGYPLIGEIISYMESKKTRYVVVDAGFRETYFSINPQLEKYVYSNYRVEKEINGVKIYARNT